MMKKEFVFKLALILCIVLLVYRLGIKPMLGPDYYFEGATNNEWAKSRLTKEQDRYDVIVVGEEPDGIAAAVSAARAGARTLLVAEGQDLGGSVSRCLYPEMEVSTGPNGELLSRGIFGEMYDKLGESFSIGKYKTVVNKLVGEEKNLETVYGAAVVSPIMENNSLQGVNISLGREKARAYYGKRFIDATREGKLLLMCNVPYFTGSGDLNLNKVFMPVLLNFELEGVNLGSNGNKASAAKTQALAAIKNYSPSHIHIKLNNFNIIKQENNRAIVRGIEVSGVDVTDEKAVAAAYKEAADEARDITAFLSGRVDAFKNCKLSKTAEAFYVRENRHFLGEHVLSVNELLENKDFDDKIALGSYPVEVGKLDDTGRMDVMGKPAMYGIPLGSIVPLKIDNLLMTGGKISCSSLASSSVGTVGTSIATGESAGVAAVYSIVNQVTPRDMVKKEDAQRVKEMQALLKRQGMYLPKIDLKNPNASNWSYPSVKKLNSLGLIAGGLKNDYQFDRKARQEDLAILLINGVYRLAPDRYSLELDSKIRPYFVKEKLTKGKAAEILAALYGLNIDKAGAYDRVCQLGYMDNQMQMKLAKLSEQEALAMDDIFYLSAYNIELFTGKKIPE
ncbi:MAG: FAD-dependent oxidoreductase [Clostridiales bacterium]|jgi:hypothetical protein|nr:FAD-dependent oxidoreductase [Eubacteriales bacterium]MDH7567821.1 FAD-dependent oxidoreductase [Clostridiales bacterium]